MKQIAFWLTAQITKSIGKSEDYSLINYAVATILEELVTLLIALAVVFVCFGEVGNTLVFAMFFAILRRFAGGIHSNTYFGCVLVTTCMFCISMWSVKNMNFNIIFVMAIVSSGIIWCLSPAETGNRKTNLRQHCRNQYMARWILVYYWLIVALLFNTESAVMIQVVIVLIAILQVVERFLITKRFELKRFYKSINSYVKTFMVMAILSICTFVCENTVQCVSKTWAYQDDIPDDIQRKFDNM